MSASARMSERVEDFVCLTLRAVGAVSKEQEHALTWCYVGTHTLLLR